MEAQRGHCSHLGLRGPKRMIQVDVGYSHSGPQSAAVTQA